jgi:predicted RNA-binding Zn-ribbon protein involved in translation (DUF1610 family)
LNVDPDVTCPSCGTADVTRGSEIDASIHGPGKVGVPVDAELWHCFRCEHVFTPVPCPSCGSYVIDGAWGTSGVMWERSQVVVRCMTCLEELPPHPSVMAG